MRLLKPLNDVVVQIMKLYVGSWPLLDWESQMSWLLCPVEQTVVDPSGCTPMCIRLEKLNLGAICHWDQYRKIGLARKEFR